MEEKEIKVEQLKEDIWDEVNDIENENNSSNTKKESEATLYARKYKKEHEWLMKELAK